MITEKFYLKIKKIVQEFKKQMNLSDDKNFLCQHNWIYKTFGWSKLPPFRHCSKCNKFEY